MWAMTIATIPYALMRSRDWNNTCNNIGEDVCTYSTEYSSTYSQSGGLNYESSVSGLYTVRGRIGAAMGRFMLFGTGGLAVGQVEMSTRASTSESSKSDWSGKSRFEPLGNEAYTQTVDTGTSSSAANTTWSKSESETAYGYAVGGGLSFAVTNNFIWTTDGYYYDLGEHSIEAKSSVGDSTYEITQRFDGYVMRTGLEWKF
jgi:outer membrane immunogenic protein